MRAFPMWLAMTACAMGAQAGPGEAAVRFLEKVRDRSVNLEPGEDTALSSTTSERKRREIARRLDRMAGDLGGSPLELGEVRQDGELAGVLVRKGGGFDPRRLQVIPLAMVRRGADWLAAPVPASFENSGVGYEAGLRKRIAGLENWLLHEQARDLENLRVRSEERLRGRIETQLQAGKLRGMDSKQVAELFFSACESHNLPQMLGLLGGLSEDRGDNWWMCLGAADAAVNSGVEGPGRPWRLLLGREVLRLPVYHEETDEDQALTAIACLDPRVDDGGSRSVKVEILHLGMSRTADGLWRIDLPDSFLHGGSGASVSADDELESDLLDMFPAKLRVRYPAAPEETAAKARDSLLSALRSHEPAAWVKLIHFTGDPKGIREDCAMAAKVWWNTGDPEFVGAMVLLEMQEDGDHAAASIQVFDVRSPDRFDLRILHFEKSPMGWLWRPVPPADTRKAVLDWTKEQSAKWEDQWREALLVDCPVLDDFGKAAAPSEADARRMVDSWLKTICKGDVEGALKLTSRLKVEDSVPSLLRNLGYELNGARRFRQSPEIVGVRQGKCVTLVLVRAAVGGKTLYPLYTVAGTPSGPRILMEVDLAAANNRTREYLNGQVLQRIGNLAPDAGRELREFCADFQKDCGGKADP